jgi:hypothetical protein
MTWLAINGKYSGFMRCLHLCFLVTSKEQGIALKMIINSVPATVAESTYCPFQEFISRP